MSFVITIPSTVMLPAPKAYTATAGSKRSHEDSQSDSPSPEPKWTRCTSMEGTVTLQEILDDVLDENPKHDPALSMFLESCSCHECHTYGHGGYTRKHGVESLTGEISGFFNYFCPRKLCTPWRKEMERFASALRAVVIHCIKEGYLHKKDLDVKCCLKTIAVARKLQGRKIIEELTTLYDTKWWDSLQQKEKDEEKDASTFGDAYESRRSSEMNVMVKEVRTDGWLLDIGSCGYGFGGKDDAPVFVRLPPEVAKLGMQDMSMSCMSLGYRNGEWQPFNAYGEGGPLANVYPPFG
jgi:hypothetical protein